MSLSPAMPLPWTARKVDGQFQVRCAEGAMFLALNYAFGVAAAHDAQRKNADYLVHAANQHPALVAALHDLVRSMEPATEANEEWWLGYHDLLVSREIHPTTEAVQRACLEVAVEVLRAARGES